MTVSLLHRLTQLPQDWTKSLAITRLCRGDASEASTTTDLIDAGADPTELARAIAAVATSHERRVFVATLSEEQRRLLDDRPDTPQAQRIVRWLEQAAKTPIAQRVSKIHEREMVRGTAGEPAAVVILWDGAIRATPIARRTRESRRYTLSSDVIEWVDAESERRGESASAVVEGALRAARGGP